LVGWLVGWLVGLVHWVRWLRWLVGWLVGWLLACFVGWMLVWSVNQSTCKTSTTMGWILKKFDAEEFYEKLSSHIFYLD
jgi:hypothetical protein